MDGTRDQRHQPQDPPRVHIHLLQCRLCSRCTGETFRVTQPDPGIVMRSAKLALVAVAVFLIASRALADAPEVGFQAQIGISSAVERGGDVQKSELTFESRIDVWFGNNARLTGIGLVRADFADELEPGRPGNEVRTSASSRATFAGQVEFELRELFVDFEVGEIQTRIGKQQVV